MNKETVLEKSRKENLLDNERKRLPKLSNVLNFLFTIALLFSFVMHIIQLVKNG